MNWLVAGYDSLYGLRRDHHAEHQTILCAILVTNIVQNIGHDYLLLVIITRITLCVL